MKKLFYIVGGVVSVFVLGTYFGQSTGPVAAPASQTAAPAQVLQINAPATPPSESIAVSAQISDPTERKPEPAPVPKPAPKIEPKPEPKQESKPEPAPTTVVEKNSAPVQPAPASETEPQPTNPPPTVESPSCDPNYTGACVPIASDVDCAGGSGNGPAYVRGPVYVVGRDIYKLDSDGDKVACEK